MAREITFESVKFAANELIKGSWAAIKPMLDALTDEEIEKMPSILSEPSARETAERYGLCDVIDRKGKWIYVYLISGYLFKGETKLHNLDD